MKLKLRHGKTHFSPSQLKKLYLSVGQLNAYLKRVFVSSSQMDFGSLVHTLILEPHEFESRYYVLDNKAICEEIGGARPTSTKKYGEWMDIQKATAGDKIIISQDDKDVAEMIYQKAVMLGIIDTFFTDGEAEKTVKGVVKDYNEEFDALCIIDYDTPFMSVDLKTTSKPLHKFKYDANELGYDIQASVTHGLNKKEFVFVVVQTVEPYDIGVFTCSEFFMNRGKEKVNKALSNYQSYEDKYSSQVLNFEL